MTTRAGGLGTFDNEAILDLAFRIASFLSGRNTEHRSDENYLTFSNDIDNANAVPIIQVKLRLHSRLLFPKHFMLLSRQFNYFLRSAIGTENLTC